MGDFWTYIIYLGLLLGIILLLLTKKQVFSSTQDDLFDTYNKIQVQDLFILILLITIVGFRYNVGVDWPAYKNYFEDFNKNLSYGYQGMEAGYYFINYLVSYIGGGYVIVFSIAAALSWFFILKSVPSKLLPLIIFFIFCDGYFFWSMNGVRQFIAVAIFAFSIKYIIRKELFNFFIFIALATLFHQSAILLLPLYFLPYHLLYNRKWWMIAFIVSFLFSGTSFILSGLPTIFKAISSIIPFLEGYNHYFETKYYIGKQLPGTGLGYFFRIIISFLFLFFSKPMLEKYPNSRIYFILFFIGIIIYNLFFTLQIVERFTIYFLFLRAYLLGILVYYLFKSKSFHFIGVSVLILYFILLWTDISNSANECCPYQFAI